VEKAMVAQRTIDAWAVDLHLFPLERLLPAGQALSVNTTYFVISLVSTTSVASNPIHLERPVTEGDMRLLLVLLESPYYCPHEVLRASLFCSYRGLLAGIFAPDAAAGAEWRAVIQENRRLLQQAQALGTWRKELKPLYNALSELRPKLCPFGLAVSISATHAAYALTSLPYPHKQMGNKIHDLFPFESLSPAHRLSL
jgi:hypothetical protein